MYRFVLVLICILLLPVSARADLVYETVRIEFVPEMAAIWVQVQYMHSSRHGISITKEIKKTLKKKYGIYYLEDNIEADQEGWITKVNKIDKTFTYADKKINVIVNPVPQNNNMNAMFCAGHSGAELSIIVNGEVKVKKMELITDDCQKARGAVVVSYEIDRDLIVSPDIPEVVR